MQFVFLLCSIAGGPAALSLILTFKTKITIELVERSRSSIMQACFQRWCFQRFLFYRAVLQDVSLCNRAPMLLGDIFRTPSLHGGTAIASLDRVRGGGVRLDSLAFPGTDLNLKDKKISTSATYFFLLNNIFKNTVWILFPQRLLDLIGRFK